MNPKVSLVIPVYNSESYLSKCLDSVLNQTYKNYEIILVNDGSTDNSLEVIKSYKNMYPKIIKYVTKKNMGPGYARNEGIKMATGEYLMFVDSDDYIDNDYIERYMLPLSEEKYDLVIGGYRYFDNKGVVEERHLFNNEWAKYLSIGPCGKLHNLEFILKNNIRFSNDMVGEDRYFSMLSYAKTKKIKIIDYVGYNYYQDNKNSISKTIGKNLSFEYIPLMNKLMESHNNKMNDTLNYYYLRMVISHLLAARNVGFSRFIDEYTKQFNWLEENKIKIKLYLMKKEIKGEKFRILLIINIFIILSKLKLIPLFAHLYCN